MYGVGREGLIISEFECSISDLLGIVLQMLLCYDEIATSRLR